VRLFLKNSIILINKEKLVHLIHSKQEPFILVNGKEVSVMGQESKHGLMVPSILENGKRIELMAKVDLFMLMGIYMMDFGQMIKRTDTECISMLTELNMKVNGRMICSMVKEWKLGLMAQDMKETMLSEENMELGLINGMMEVNILVSGRKIKLVESESTHG
jgi:hypothetical protein